MMKFWLNTFFMSTKIECIYICVCVKDDFDKFIIFDTQFLAVLFAAKN